MTKEEFVDNIAVANRTVKNFEDAIKKVQITKNEAVSLFITLNHKFEPGERVRVYVKNDQKDLSFIGYGFINGILVDEDYGVLFYPLLKEDASNKQPINEGYEQMGVHEIDKNNGHLIIKKV